MTYKPDGHNDLSPYLIVSDAQAVLDFAIAAFGAKTLRVFHRDDGSIMHAETRIGDSVLMIGQADGPPAHLHLYMPDPDAMLDRAVELGATLVQQMKNDEHGDRRGGVQTDDGTTWWLSKQVNA
ncbi:VOC family protein [uncultured Litoreibacter sp.]|uniref:VOC family protein n=1 Tax=uncultured Litoreibacter sp. TaxID=1392394 RepID=UPI002639F121|nr:VOC family protein [uncultured Litoreibacter sp.]